MTAKEILYEELSQQMIDTVNSIECFEQYIIDAMERYASQNTYRYPLLTIK